MSVLLLLSLSGLVISNQPDFSLGSTSVPSINEDIETASKPVRESKTRLATPADAASSTPVAEIGFSEQASTSADEAESVSSNTPQALSSVLVLEKDGRFTVRAADDKLLNVVRELSRVSGLEMQLDDRLDDTRVDIQLHDASMEEVLAELGDSRAEILQKHGDDYEVTSVLITAQVDEVPVATEVDEPDEPVTAPMPAGVLSNTDDARHRIMARDRNAILLQNAIIDVDVAVREGVSVEVPAPYKARDDHEYFIVHFADRLSQRHRAQLEELGATVSHYVPNSAYAVRIPEGTLEAARALPGVGYVEPYHPYYKMSTDILSYKVGEPDDVVADRVEAGEYHVILFKGAEPSDLPSGLAAEILFESTVAGRSVVGMRTGPENIDALLMANVVQWVEPIPKLQPMNDLGNRTVRATSLQQLHPALDGAGVIVNVNDSGIDFTNPNFAIDPSQATSTNLNTRILHYVAAPSVTTDGVPGDNNGHGTHVSGSILANGALSDTVGNSPGSGPGPYATNAFRGVAPKARLVMIEDFNSHSGEEMAEIAYEHGARISNNSWGAAIFEYGFFSMVWDELVRDALPSVAGNQQLIAFFAAGNSGGGDWDGTGATPATIGQPGNAKNVISVGAVEQARFADNLLNVNSFDAEGNLTGTFHSDLETDSDWQVAPFSSRGPATSSDPRVKPDIVAPGTYVLSVQSHETSVHLFDDPSGLRRDFNFGNVQTGTNFAFYSGTSMASPLAAGGGALMYQHYTNTYGVAPSPAMMKAMMVSGARMLHSLVYKYPQHPSLIEIADQGWGMLDVVRAVDGPRIQPSDELIVLDQSQTSPLSTDQFFTRQFTVNEGEGGFKVVLAWTDHPGTPGTGPQLINDLDLMIQAPGGGGYLGNRFKADGVHSHRFTTLDSISGDGFNNVEIVVEPNAVPGTYSVQVYGRQVPEGPQDFALIIMKGIAFEGRNQGQEPALAMDDNDNPVLAYSTKVGLNQQIYVKRWKGPVGDVSDIDSWKRMDDQWFALRDSAEGTGISKTLADSEDPAVAVDADKVYVAWLEQPQLPVTKRHVYLKRFDGNGWTPLGPSVLSGVGVSGASPYHADHPMVAVMGDGSPLVAWKQQLSPTEGERVFVARWDGANWVGLADSHNNGVPVNGGPFAAVDTPSLVVDSFGMPVVSWADDTVQRIQVRRWNGASWVNLDNQGLAPFVEDSHLAAGPSGDLFLTWIQTHGSNPGSNLSYQVFARRYAGGVWSAMGESMTFPGISKETVSTNLPHSPRIAGAPGGRAVVTWVAGTNSPNALLARQFDGSSWVDIAGASARPGVTGLPGGLNRVPAISSDTEGVPVISFQNHRPEYSYTNEVLTYTLVADTDPPLFAGLQSAEGGTNSNVFLSWNAAQDNFATNISYHIYISTNDYPCTDIPMCDPGDVFDNLLVTVTNLTEFEVTSALTNLVDYRLYCFGVRAEDENGFIEENTVTHFAGPTAPGVGCFEVDTDGDGIPDWWEDLHFGSPTGAVATASNVVVGVNTLTYGEAYDRGTDPFAIDSDGDGLMDWDEVHTHETDPTKPDTDGDGLPDGMEVGIGSDPLHWDSNLSRVGDGDVFELGMDPTAAGITNLNILLEDDFETGTNGWVLTAPSQSLPWNYWHLSTAEPAPSALNVTRIIDRSTNTAFRMAIDPTGTNVNAGYSQGTPLLAALDSPPGAVDATGVTNLFVQWREFFETEPGQDFISVQARSGQHPNWVVVSMPRTGSRTNNQWDVNRANLSQFAGHSDVQVRFLFQANAINNHFAGWYVDDVIIYEGATIKGWVRDVNGRPLVGATVRAIGQGGITNVVDGHQRMAAGKVFGSAQTGADGAYAINGLPLGHYYVKADAAGFRAEFFDGQLFAPSYGFGNVDNPGVFNIDEVTGGYLDLSVAGASVADDVHFELERGDVRTHLSVAHTQNVNSVDVRINHADIRVWDGSTNAMTTNFVSYQTLNTLAVTNNHPDWVNNPVQPVFYGELNPGTHRVTMGPNLWYVPQVPAQTRAGEYTRVNLVTADVSASMATSTVGRGYMFVASLDGLSHPIYVNGEPTGDTTPALLHVQAGTHIVDLVPGSYKGVTPIEVSVPFGGRTNVAFSADQINGLTGSMRVIARDPFGNTITNTPVEIYLNGLLVGTNDVPLDSPHHAPAVIDNLREGFHLVSVRANGFRDSETRKLEISASFTNLAQFVLFQSDEDYDRVGDHTEIIGYTNIFMYGPNEDPDSDGLNNFQEFEMFRNFGILMNPFDEDTDGDGMLDGDEVGYSGFVNAAQVGSGGYMNQPEHVMYALTTLHTNAVQDTDAVRTEFAGRFLDGISNFEQPTNTRYVVSIRGDRFVASDMTHNVPAVPTKEPVVTVFSGIPPSTWTESVSQGHPGGVNVYADTRPDRVDTDGDAMWDGFEFQHKFYTNAFNDVVRILDPIEAGRTDADPDADGWSNYQEFLGPDGVPNTNDWTAANNPDTDGDGMPDGWEFFFGLDPNDPSDAWDDMAGNNLPNLLEYQYGTNPRLFDTDGDGIGDGDEVFGTLNPWKQDAFFPEFSGSSDPLNPDTDSDALMDGLEITLGTNPNRWDTSGDGMSDGFAVLDPFGNLLPEDQRLDPLDPLEGGRDASGDGMSNLENFLVRDGLGNFGQPPEGVVWDYWLDPLSTDTDGDGMPDVFEVFFGLHPLDPVITKVGDSFTRYDGLSSGGDLDGDGLWNLREYEVRFHLDAAADPFIMPGLSTDPQDTDSDDEGLGDGEEDRSFRTDPTRQDTDRDGLMDGSGLADRLGEVETAFRQSLYMVVETNVTWEEARELAATYNHPYHPGVAGQLAVVRSLDDQSTIETELSSVSGLFALGGRAAGTGSGPPNWITGEYVAPVEENTLVELLIVDLPYAPGEPLVSDGFLGIDADAASGNNWVARDDTNVFSGFVLEFEHNPVETNHYDLALNDLWQLIWPGLQDLPHWEQVPVDDDSPLPPPRWGHASTYIPVFETKLPRDRSPDSDDNTIILMDNRQLMVVGGRDGVSRYADLWEYQIRSNRWHRSEVPMNSDQSLNLWGRSEFQAITKFSYRNTRPNLPDYPVLFDSLGDGFGLPTHRPWPDSRSMDWTLLFGGWDDEYDYYMGHVYYKSTDDPRPIVEELHPLTGNAGVTEFVIVPDRATAQNTIRAATLNDATRFAIGDGVSLLHDDAVPSATGPGLAPEDMTGYAALNFGAFALIPETHELDFVELILDIRDPSPSSFGVDVLAEITAALRHSETEYDSSPDELEPSLRAAGGIFYTSQLTNFNVTAGSTASITVDVTELVRDIWANPEGFDGSTIGFVFHATNATDFALIGTTSSRIRANYKPKYKIPPEWRFPTSLGLIRTGDTQFLSQRKSHAMVYNYDRDRVFLFGGIDGNRVMGDTHEGTINIGANPGGIVWRSIVSPNNPPPRWGHSMVYDRQRNRIVMFGGFDENHEPLNDLWIYQFPDVEDDAEDEEEDDPIDEDPADEEDEGPNFEEAIEDGFSPGEWIEITELTTADWPQPRGGAAMIYYGDFDYDRGIVQGGGFNEDYRVGANKRSVVLFGGTDGKRYFNDTWVLVGSRWRLVNPVGELSQAPPPRAFASFDWGQNARVLPDPDGSAVFRENVPPPDGPGAKPSALLFGGRTGPLPTGEDTDGDLVDDGVEHAIGGPSGGRDPRVSAITEPDHPVETLPFSFVRIGPVYGLLIEQRGMIADMESLRHDDGIYAGNRGFPYEPWPHPDSTVTISPVTDRGVQTRVPEQSKLWYSRHGLGAPFDDPGNVWELGVPDPSAAEENAVPPYAYSGRWVFGTRLSGPYPNDAKMELYSPMFDLTLPPSNATSTNNPNAYHLIFHEWLDLADANDKVKVEVIRPTTPADRHTRVTGTNKTTLTIVGERNFAFNTTGQWRRVIAPLSVTANESNLFLRFTMETDTNNVAGGWYIDDVAIIQGADIEGTYPGAGAGQAVDLLGADGTVLETTFTFADGSFGFGLLPSGEYQIQADNLSAGPFVLGGTNSLQQAELEEILPFVLNNISGSPAEVMWNADVGTSYDIQSTTNLWVNPQVWQNVATNVIAGSTNMSYTDTNIAVNLRFYRVIEN